MVRIDATYDGDLRCTATHGPSGAKLITDAPVDNHGKGDSFSPTDLLATSMLTCIMTIIGIRANSRDIDVNGMSGSVEKSMGLDPRRVAQLDVIIRARHQSSAIRHHIHISICCARHAMQILQPLKCHGIATVKAFACRIH